MDTMMALRAHTRGGPEQLVYEQAPKPVPGSGDVLVRVHAAAITYSELGWDLTWTRKDGTDRTPIIPGHEVSGVVEQTTGSSAFEVGDEVFGLVDFDRDGAAAQYVCVAEEGIALKPRRASHQEAAAMAMSALTAWQALRDQADIQPTEKVLVTGGPGGVGSYAVQIARACGAQVAATGGEAGRELVTKLGAKPYLDYRAEPVDRVLSEFDVVIDAAGTGDDEALYRVLRAGGRMILLAAPPDSARAQEHDVHATFFVVSNDAQELSQLAGFVDSGVLKPILGQTFPLSEGRSAYESGARPHPPGKTVLTVE